jgi:hypothetical protein
MKKKYRLTIDISVDINEKVKVKGKPKLLGHIQQLLKAFLKNEKALQEYYTFYFPNMLLKGDCYDYLLEILKAKDVPNIVAALNLKNELTPDAEDFIETIYSTDDDIHIKADVCVQYRDLFADQFSEPEITVAEFKEI